MLHLQTLPFSAFSSMLGLTAILWLSAFNPLIVKAQSVDPLPAECAMDGEESEEFGQGSSESSSSGHFCTTAIETIYNDLSRYTPVGEDIKLRVNFIIIQRQDGTGNFQDIPEHRAFLDDWLDECNYGLGNTWWSSDPGCQPSASSTGIQIVPNWIFLPDPSGTEYYWNYWNHSGNSFRGCPNSSAWWLGGLDQIINNDPSIPRGINVYFTIDANVYHQMVVLQTIDDPADAGMHYTWCSEHPSITDLTKPSRIHIANMFLKYWWFKNHEQVVGAPFSVSRAWLVKEGLTLMHELAHSLVQEYVHYHNCDDHMLDPGTGRSLRLIDVQYMHRGLVHNNLRQFIDCDERYNASMYSSDREWNIISDEEWVRDMRLYHNLRVSAGATLTIRCKVLLPEDGVVIVERGGRLIADGGRIWRANTCSKDQHWAGIAVNGNPSALQPNPYGTLTSSDGGVVLLMGDGEIEGGALGVVAQSHPHWDGPTDRGGLIQAEHFTFRDNKRAVQFMRYDYPNFSKFIDVNFINNNGNATRGVTIWRTDNILFEGCTFQKLTRNGIETIDASYDVLKRNQFINCEETGITAGATMPLPGIINIGDTYNFGTDRNRFINNTVGIRGTSNIYTDIVNNYMSDLDFDVAITGESRNIVRFNDLKGKVAGIQFESTGRYANDAQCNEYDQNTVGINVIGDNQSFNFVGENFDSKVHDLFIEGLSTNPGRIMINQGSSGNARWNYFTAGKPEQIKTSTIAPWNNTVHFNYFHPSPFINLLLRPRCASNDLSCLPSSNFSNFLGTGNDGECGIFAPIIEECLDEACLDSLRTAISVIEESLAAEVADEGIEDVLEDLIVKRERAVVHLLNQYAAEGKWDAAEELLAGDPNPENLRRLVGLALKRDKFSHADSLLSAFPNTSLEDEQFVAVQQINLAFLSDSAFALSPSQEEILTEIALSGTTQSGYAQSLLLLLTGETFMPRLPILGEAAEEALEFGSRPIINSLTQKLTGLTAYPNPANSQLTISWKIGDGLSATDNVGELLILEPISGRSLLATMIYDNLPMTLNIALWPDGLYLLAIRGVESGDIVATQMIAVRR